MTDRESPQAPGDGATGMRSVQTAVVEARQAMPTYANRRRTDERKIPKGSRFHSSGIATWKAEKRERDPLRAISQR